MPVVHAVHDDAGKSVGPDASHWKRLHSHGTTRRLGYVLASIIVAATFLVVINLTMKPRKIKCASIDDCRKVKRLNTVIVGVRSLLNTVISIVLVFSILSQLGVDAMGLFATAGVLGIVLGFGAQSMIKSLFAGTQIMVGGKFAVGDLVKLELTTNIHIKGVVSDFSLQATTIRDLAGAKYFVANGDIISVTNYSQNYQRAQVEVSVSHMADVNTVLQHMRALAAEMAVERVLLDKVIRPPVVKGVTSTGPDSYTVAIAATVVPEEVLFVERFMRQRVLAHLRANNIAAATHHTYTVHTTQTPESYRVTAHKAGPRMLSPETVRSITPSKAETVDEDDDTSDLDLSA